MSKPPILSEKPKTDGYLGTHRVTSGKFDSMSHKELSGGPGMISGRAMVNGKPCDGLKIRLALNGEVWSQWAVTDSRGKYNISVPYGNYRIDGWNLDDQTPNKVLPGKIHHPAIIFSMFDSFNVDRENRGEGPILYFVDPVKVIQPVGEVVLSDDLVLEWEPYPNAAFYRIQIKDHGEGWKIVGERLYKAWGDEPVVKRTKVTFKEIGAELRKGSYYTPTIEALNEDRYQLSKSLDSREVGFYISK